MKIRLLGTGYDKFTGEFGTVWFEDGVSVTDVSDIQARRFAALLSIECVDDGKDPGDGAKFQRLLDVGAVTVNYETKAQRLAREKAENGGQEKEVKKQEAKEPVVVYTREQLEQLADSKGIKGLREVGDKVGVRGSDIKKLINAILAAQPGGAAAVETSDTQVGG